MQGRVEDVAVEKTMLTLPDMSELMNKQAASSGSRHAAVTTAYMQNKKRNTRRGRTGPRPIY